jgi:NAD(P)-dependent dehydrogenase (short-subunit alcohol dehydrogenase family)
MSSPERFCSLEGKQALVTGGSRGIGAAIVRELAGAGAQVAVGFNSGADEANAIAREVGGRAIQADVSSPEGAARLVEEAGDVDLLVNNAGVMAPPRRETEDGFELQFGTNVLGHFALTALLIGLMQGRDDARVVTVSSNAHKMGKINFDDLQSERRYMRWAAYGQSKLADLMFALELDRRLRASGSTVSSLAAHPGYAATNLQSAAPPLLDRVVMVFTNLVVAQSADMGALPILFAATAPGLEGGVYVGPDGLGEFRGHPKVVGTSRAARDEKVAARLWSVCEELTGVTFELGAGATA